MQYLKIYFSFASTVFRFLSNDIALKGLFLHNCVVFSLFCVARVIFETVFERAYFATIRRNKFPARYFWYKAKLKQKKFILKSWALCFYASYSIRSNFRKWFQLSHRTWSHFLVAFLRVCFCNVLRYFLLNLLSYNLRISEVIMNDKFVSAP